MPNRQSLKNVMKLLDEANTDVPVEESFLSNLKRSIELTSMKNIAKPSQTYKPSGMNCIRAMYYAVVGEEPDRDEASYVLTGICNSGTDIHVRVQNAVADMQSNDMDCEYIDVAEFIKERGLDDKLVIRERNASGTETKLYYPEFNLSFMCDGIIRYKNHYYIIEFKTETSYKWSSRRGVDPKHYKQATAYSLALELDEVLFVYISRDNLDMKCYKFEVTPEMRRDLMNLIYTCDAYVKEHKAPAIPTDINERLCAYCSYKSLCKGERNEQS